MIEKIGFVGYECEDIIMYLANCLTEHGKRVVIEDRTEHGILLQMLEAKYRIEQGEEAEVVFNGIPVTNAMIYSEEYDIVLIYFGYRLLHPKLYECNRLVLVTDALPAHALLLRKIEEWERKQILLVKDYTESKHGLHYLTLLTGQTVDSVLCLPWEERDKRIRNSLGTAENIRTEKLSAQMKEIIRQLKVFALSDEAEREENTAGRRMRTWGS